MTDLEEIQDEYEYVYGNPTPLANRIRSGKPLSKRTREIVARIIEGKLTKRQGRKPTHGRGKPLIGLVLNAYDQECKRLRDEGEPDLHWATCEAVAKRWPGVSANWVDKVKYPNNRRSKPKRRTNSQ